MLEMSGARLHASNRCDLPGTTDRVKLIAVQVKGAFGLTSIKRKTYTAHKEKTLSVKTLRRVRLLFIHQ